MVEHDVFSTVIAVEQQDGAPCHEDGEDEDVAIHRTPEIARQGAIQPLRAQTGDLPSARLTSAR